MDEARRDAGVVVVHTLDRRTLNDGHEMATRAAVARRLAAIHGLEFGGEFDPARRQAGRIYHVPSDTILGGFAAGIGVAGEDDLFGGVVPHRFVSSKAISHRLVAEDAVAPEGWSEAFGSAVSGVVLDGFTAFSVADARRAGERLLARGPARLKPVNATGGRGQTVFRSLPELEAALAACAEPGEGLVVEENLSEVVTFSVGEVRVAGLVAAYYGTQHTTRDNDGRAAYGGSDLTVIRGGLEDLAGHAPNPEIRTAIGQARAYDAAAGTCFPALFASRRNYDVALGLAADGRARSGVLEQSWRIGGASPAEIVALEAFLADESLMKVQASSKEVYGSATKLPAAAIVFFQGNDRSVGALTKYALIVPP